MTERILSIGADPAPRDTGDMLEMPDGSSITRDEFESAINRGRRMAQQRREFQIQARRERKRKRALFVTVRKRVYRCLGRTRYGVYACSWTGEKPTVEYTGRRRKLCPECGAAVERMDS